MTPAMIPMISPDGRSGDVPADKLGDAAAVGFKLAVAMTSPDGKLGYVPHDRAADALKAGFRVGQPAVQDEALKRSQGPSLLTQPREFLAKRSAELNQEEQNQVNQAVGPESQGKGFVTRAGHSLASLVPATASVIDKAAAGLMDWKNALAIVSGLIDPAIPAAYFGAQGTIGTAQGVKQIAKEGPTPSNVQDTLLNASMMAAAPAAAASPKAGGMPDLVKTSAAKLNPQGALAPRMAEIPPGEQFTRQEVLDAARDHGVNLDVAQASGSKVATAVKKANQYSLTGAGAYEANAKGNRAALEQWADQEASQYSPPADREVVGGQIKKAFQDDLAQRKAEATNAFSQLDEEVGANVLNGAPVEALARQIVNMNSGYYKLHPELKPTKAWAILEDLAKRPKIPQNVPGAEGVMDAAGNPVQTGSLKTVEAPTRAFSWSELHNMRSDLMDFYRNNPDIVKGRGEAWIQQMVGKIDEVMTDSANNGLAPADLAKFRQANATWESMKATYDNPQSPLYHAVRAQFPSQVPGMLMKGTPELARQVRDILGDQNGSFQRQFVEGLTSDKNGNLDLGKLDNKLSRMPNDFLEEMVGADGARNLKLLGKVSKSVNFDANPSGTAKVGIPASEVTTFFHNPAVGAADFAAQYGASRAMNSPRFLDYLVGPDGKVRLRDLVRDSR